MRALTTTLLAGIAVGAVVTVLLFGGVRDTMRALGLSDETCAEIITTGREICGEDLRELCRAIPQRFRPEVCHEALLDRP